MSQIAPTIPEPVQIAARRRLSATVRLALHAAYDGLCAACGKPLPINWQLDHRIPLKVGGKDEPSNWQPLCAVPCHADKTNKLDKPAIAKAKRRERKADPETRKPSQMQSRPFPTDLRRRFDGTVSKRPARSESR